MAVRVTSLGSGSSGNALLVESGTMALLVDCGLSQRAIERQLRRYERSPADLCAIVLTHEHGDHCLSAAPLSRRHGIPIVANRPTAAALGTALDGLVVQFLETGAHMQIGPFNIRSFAVSHDAAAPVGYTIQSAGWCVGVAIDLGCWNDTQVAALAAADLLVVEANHDRERLRTAPYSWPTKQRIARPTGHLDNVAAGELLARICADGRQRTAWLAHLSQEANSPAIAVKVVRSILRLAGCMQVQVAALPRRATLVWESAQHSTQLELFRDLGEYQSHE
ncbi:MAG TPA: MBL fold metallo-hydrolase [Roseiflexaceae bacterium]|nr:MBL fold metallo-hydrolase [Roseiflexaceae bacterium]HMP43309.1 MBL fold metallo-hydrolase [Roseiflexaceae bacterium]